MTDILRADGNEFTLKAHIIGALRKQGCEEDYVPVKTENGGWIGVPVGDPRIEEMTEFEPVVEKTPKDKYLCRVYRANCDEANRDQIIKVTVNSFNNRKVFKPGEEVELNISQINVLKDSVVDTEIHIEPSSGIYSSKNPEAAAKNQYPGFQIRKDQTTGYITAFKHEPKYIIEYLEDRP